MFGFYLISNSFSCEQTSEWDKYKKQICWRRDNKLEKKLRVKMKWDLKEIKSDK